MLNRDERKELVLAIEENQLLDDLFNHPGMKTFLDHAQEWFNQLNNLDGVNSLEDLHFKRGQIKVLRWFQTWQTHVKETLVNLVEEAEHETRLAKDANEVLDFDDPY